MSRAAESMDEHQRRVGRNEALFRVINERMESLNESFGAVTNDFQIVCECGDRTCVTQLVIATADYGRVRRDATLFVIARGHEDATAEAVVEEDQRGYVVVRKYPGGPAEAAVDSAPD